MTTLQIDSEQSGRHIAPTDPQIVALQAEVRRISVALARLKQNGLSLLPSSPLIDDHSIPKAQHDRAGSASEDSAPTVTSAQVRAILRQRRARDEMFDEGIFADPAWDMLLDLYAASLDHRAITVSSLCIAAAVPATTALRWIKALTSQGLFARVPDRRDARRVYISLTPKSMSAMNRYFARAPQVTDFV